MHIGFKGKIYVMCPAYLATGGTELLHQLVYKLVHVFGIEAYIYYPDIEWKYEMPPTPKRFEKYVQKNVADAVEDEQANVLVIPETLVRHVPKFSKVRTLFWWLSVDNFYGQFGIHYQSQTVKEQVKNAVKKSINRYPFNIINTAFNRSVIYMHLVQSKYAFEFLKKRGFSNVQYLSDYINADTYSLSPAQERASQVVYNPLKGKAFTARLIDAAPQVKWVPLQRMTPAEMAVLMKRSKVYIDFGNHPGKDRIPREAAMNGCIIITNKNGAAKYQEDVAIPERFKFDQEGKRVPEITNTIKECLEDYDTVIREFENYRAKIKAEEMIFEREIKAIIDRIQ